MNIKSLTRIGVVLVLVGFPLLSWIYLGMGIDFRKKMIKRLATKTEISTFNFHIDSTKAFASQSIENYTSLVCFITTQDNDLNTLISNALDQLKDRDDFKIILLHNSSTKCNIQHEHVSCYELNDTVLSGVKYENLGFPLTYTDNVVALVDTALHVRMFYDLDSVEINRIYEDLVFILPPSKDKNVAIKQ